MSSSENEHDEKVGSLGQRFCRLSQKLIFGIAELATKRIPKLASYLFKIAEEPVKSLKVMFTIIVLVLGIVIIATYQLKKFFAPEHKSGHLTSILAIYPVDKLYTNYAFIPAVFMKISKKNDGDILPSDHFIYGRKLTKDEKLLGYCVRNYKVSFGYEHAKDYFNEENKTFACNNVFEKLPVPTIIGIDALTSKLEGDFSQVKCDSYDNPDEKTSTGVPVKKDYINYVLITRTDLQETTLQETIDKKSREALGAYLKINCDKPTK